MGAEDLEKRIAKVNREMVEAAKRMEFIEAARLRDELIALQNLLEQRKTTVTD